MGGVRGGLLFAQNPTPAPAQSKSILLMNGVAHLGNGTVIENSAIGFKNGKLDLVADATTIRLQSGAYDTTINISGMHVYPGFIAPNSTLGLTEIEAVRSTRDFSETYGGVFNHLSVAQVRNAVHQQNTFGLRRSGSRVLGKEKPTPNPSH